MTANSAQGSVGAQNGTAATDTTCADSDRAYGLSNTVKHLYKTKKDEDGESTWTDKYPEDVEEPAENEETRAHAIIVRHKKSKDSRKKLEADSIIIQSPPLREALGHILRDYTGVACELQRLTFNAPFAPFIHRWVEFTTYMRQEHLDATTKEHLVLLHDILKDEIGDSIASFEDYVLTKKITFEHLWMIFQPGTVVLGTQMGPISAFELRETLYYETRCGKFFGLPVDCVDYDGKKFGRHLTRLDIAEFAGVVDITSLTAFPLDFHEDPEAIRATLTRRGELFEKVAGHHYKAYDGMAITWNEEHKEIPVYVNGRIVIDIESFSTLTIYPSHRADKWTEKDKKLLADNLKKDDNVKIDGSQITPYHHMLCRSRTSGYSLKLKKWLDFYVDNISEVVWNTDAYERLVLPQDQKDLILAFSESQIESTTFDDVISGKGKGVICLLSGPPGVGKTLTAEAVAEHMRVPLHTLTAGDLGSSPYDIEDELRRIMDLAARWKAVVLLDECDVFLEARTPYDLQRNNTVSIFLRMLEYYQGILFMTTNRVQNIDPAFRSRIHISLEYPDLNEESRRQIWKNFLTGTSFEDELSKADLDQLSSLSLNGREIKNVLKTAHLLAARKRSPLKREFIDTVLSITKR